MRLVIYCSLSLVHGLLRSHSQMYRLVKFALRHWTHRRLTTRSLGCKANPKHRRLTTRSSMCTFLGCHTKIPDMWTHRRFTRLLFHIAHLLLAVTSARAFLFKSHVYRLLRFALHHWTHRRLTTRSLGCKANPKHRRLTTRFSMCKALDCHTKIPDMWTHRRFMRLVFLVAHLLFAVIGIFVHILTCTGC